MTGSRPARVTASTLGFIVPERKPLGAFEKFLRRVTTPWHRLFSRHPLNLAEIDPLFLLRVAIHEAGHVAATIALGQGAFLTRAALLPHAGANNGIVQRQPQPHFLVTATKRDILDLITIKLGGRAAEEVFFGLDDVTLGSWGDLTAANDLAGDLIAKQGFGKSLGLAILKTKEMQLPPEVTADIKDLLASCYEEAISIVEGHRDAIREVAQQLLNEGVLDGDALRKCFTENRV